MIPWYALILDCLFGAWLCSRGTPLQGWVSISVGLIVCRAAIGLGVPMWADKPWDATDLGLIAFVGAWAAIKFGGAA